jgi:predicted RNase H-like nuclease (RuvC/YqgF family)
MTTQLDTMVEFLSGREREETDRTRLGLADPESDTARFLDAARRLSSDMFTPHFFKKMGLPLSVRDHVPDVSPRHAPPSTGRRLLHVLPWLTTASALGAILWLVLTCPCHRPNQSPANGVAGENERQRQIANLTSQLEAEKVKADGLRGQLVELPNKLRAAETENDHLRQQVTCLQRDLRAEQKEKEKRQEEAAGLRDQIEKIGRERDELRNTLSALSEEVKMRRQEARDLSNKQQEQQRVNDELRQKMLSATASAAKLSAAHDRIQQLERDVAKADANTAALAQSGTRIKELEARLAEAIEASQAKAKASGAELGQARSRIKVLEGNLMDARSRRGDLEDALAQSRARILELENGLAKVCSELVTISHTVSRMRIPDEPRGQLLRDLNKIISGLPLSSRVLKNAIFAAFFSYRLAGRAIRALVGV